MDGMARSTAASPEDATPATGVRSARRALEILSLLRETRPAISTKEIVEETGLPRTTVLRLVETLEECGLIWPTASNTYVAGPSLLRWAGLASRAWQLPAHTGELMADVARDSGETASVYVRYGTHRVCIATAEGSQALRHVARVGSEQPMWAGAPAKVLLVDTPSEVLERIARLSPAGPGHLTTLLTWRETTAHDGYAVSHGEREDGLSVVAVPVRGRSRRVIATASLAGPTPRFPDDRIPAFREALHRIAGHLEEAGFEQAPGALRID